MSELTQAEIEELRHSDDYGYTLCARAADLIESQSAEIAKLDRLVKALYTANTDEDPTERFKEMIEYIKTLYAANESKSAELTRLRAELAAVVKPATLQQQLREAIAKIETFQSERPYIVGFNDGFEHVQETLRFPIMLRKMWSGLEVQKWIDDQFARSTNPKTVKGE
jgi:hypothetical protein